jgi:hypothetical protein
LSTTPATNVRRLLKRALVSFALGTVAPLVVAQIVPGNEIGGHGHRGDSPQLQACRKQADDKKLPQGAERKAFMQQCMKASHDSSDGSKSEELREKMREGQSGHLHSEPPAAPPPPPPAPPPAAPSGSS